MRLYYADIRGIDEADALYPPSSKRKGSALGVSLVAAAYADYAGSPPSKLLALLTGRSTEPPALHYSVSHSKTHVLCALSETPVGVDTEVHRPFKQTYIERLCTPAELASFSFFDIWVLRESFFKLTGTGDLRTLRFHKRNGKVISPDPRVHARLYRDLAGSSTAVCSFENDFPETIKKVPIEALLKKDAIKRRKREKNAQTQ